MVFSTPSSSLNTKKMERINLSEDGVLVIETGRQRLLLFVRNEEDLEQMLKVFTEKKLKKVAFGQKSKRYFF